MAVSDYKTNPNENTTISGINIAEGCPPSGINNAIRQLMADVKAGCLTLAGGTVSGETQFNSGIKFPNSGQIRTSGNTDKFALTIFGDPDNFSYSRINIAAPTSKTPAEMLIVAHDGTNKAELDLKPSGALTWVGKNIVRSVNGITADTEGRVYIPYYILGSTSSKGTLPSGGTWMYVQVHWSTNGNNCSAVTGTLSGGSNINLPSTAAYHSIFAIRVK